MNLATILFNHMQKNIFTNRLTIDMWRRKILYMDAAIGAAGMKGLYMLTIDRLKEALAYDPETGFFVWRIAINSRAVVGKVAGKLKSTGYIYIGLDSEQYPAHRLAWLYMTGEWPQNSIDHIDGDRANNRFVNLRDVPASHNAQNQRRAQNGNKSGYLGVSKRGRHFYAQINVGGKIEMLGKFNTAKEAHLAYIEAKRERHEGCTI
jgi:hypothetical protein